MLEKGPISLEATLLVEDGSAFLLGALVRHDEQVVRAIRIDLDLAELAGADLVLEEHVQLGVGETLDNRRKMVSKKNKHVWRGDCLARVMRHTFGSGRRK